MKKLSLILITSTIVLLMFLLTFSSCTQRETTNYLYRVKFVKSNVKAVVKSTERGVEYYGSYKMGDTVNVTRDNIVTSDGRYRKAVIITIIK